LSTPGIGAWDEADWRLVAESIPHIVWVADDHQNILYFNQRGTAYTGMTAASGKWTELIHPDELDQVFTAWTHARRTRTAFEEDVRIRAFDGSYRWHSTRGEPLVDGDGGLTRWFGTATDVDDRKQLEERLRLAEGEASDAVRLLTQAQAAAPVGFGFIDSDYRIVRLNDEIARFAGMSVGEHLGRTVAEVVPEQWALIEPIFRHVMSSGEAVRNLPIARPEDEHGPHSEWMVSFYPVQIDDQIVGAGVVGVDVTERLEAEGFRTTVMSLVAEGVCTLDNDRRLTYMNRAASRMLGWTEDELRGRSMHDAVHFQRGDGTPLSAAECLMLTEGTERQLVQPAGDVFTRKDGTTFPVAYSWMPRQVGSRVDGFSVVFRDISAPDPNADQVRVLIADPDPASVETLSAVLTGHEGMEVVGTAATAASAVEQTVRLRPDVVLVDAALPHAGGIAATLQLKAEAAGTNVILLALDYDDAAAASAIAAGCAGIVDKQRTWVDLPDAVRAAHHGETSISHAELQQVVASVRGSRHHGRAQDLTARERDVLRCLTQGLTNHQAAAELGLTVNTVRNHVQHVLYKLDVHSRLEAVVLATRSGLLDERR
jgi:PAS domain S-box-containing protein